MSHRSLLEHGYRLGMLIYPPSFRARFGAEMIAFARERLTAARRRSRAAVAREFFVLAADIVRSAPGQWIAAVQAEPDVDYPDYSSENHPRDNMDILLQDLRFAIRGLFRRPAFTLVAALTLALGIGANTAMFSVVDAVLLQPLPYPQADRLAMVWENVNLPAYKNTHNPPAPGNFHDWRTQNTSFTDMAAIGGRSWSLTGSGEPARVDGEAVSAALFPLLQVDAAIGRVFIADEDRQGGARVVLLSHGLWSERFGADAGIIGKSIRLNDEPHTVVGVMPRGFYFPDPDDKL